VDEDEFMNLVHGYTRQNEEAAMLPNGMSRHASLDDRLMRDPNQLKEEVKQAMYALHKHDPSLWTVRRLALRFKLSSARTRGILRMAATEQAYEAAGWDTMPNHLDELLPNEPDVSMDMLLAKYRTLDNNQKRLFNHEFPPEQLSIWDPETQGKSTAFDGVYTVGPESQLEALHARERKRHYRWMSRQERRDYHEAKRFTREGYIGAPMRAPLPTHRIGKTNAPPSRYAYSLVDTSFSHRDQYKVAMRDCDGSMRTASEKELDIVRSGELDGNRRFVLHDWRRPADDWNHLRRARAKAIGGAPADANANDALAKADGTTRTLHLQRDQLVGHRSAEKAYFVGVPPGFGDERDFKLKSAQAALTGEIIAAREKKEREAAGGPGGYQRR
jgi:hypothetical protein